MLTLEEFNKSLSSNTPPPAASIYLKALWFDKNNNWNKAHALIDSLTDTDASWVHAYLHRKEGDIWNADYWYRRAGKTRPAHSLEQEWENLVRYFTK